MHWNFCTSVQYSCRTRVLMKVAYQDVSHYNHEKDLVLNGRDVLNFDDVA